MIRKPLWIAAGLLVVALGACGPSQISDVEGREFADVTEFDTNCGRDESVTSALHLPGFFDAEARVLEAVQPVLDDNGANFDMSTAVDAGGIWLFVADDGVVFGAADKASGTISFCLGG